MSDPPSSPVGQRSPIPRSPPTSPLLHSPGSSIPRPSPSPPTSPGARSADSSPSSSPLKRRRRDKENVSRTTIQRREREKKRLCLETSNDATQGQRQMYCANEDNAHESDNSVNPSVTSEESTSDEESNSSSSVHSEHSSVTSEVSSVFEANASDNSMSDNNSEEDEGMEALYKDADVTVNEALYRVLEVHVKQKWTKKSLDKIVKVIKNLLPQPNEFPSSGKAALKSLKDLTVSSYEEQEYKYCCACHKLVENCTQQDEHADEITSFFILPPSVQLKHMFEHRQLDEIIDKHREQQRINDGSINDIVDGTIYQSVSQNLDGPYDVALLWNTDGVAMSDSSNQELWPILGTIVNIPPKLRQSFIVVLGVYVGKVKPDMNVFLEPLQKCLQDSFSNGFTWTRAATKEQVTSKIVGPFMSADAPAKAMVLNTMRFNSTYGCNICEQKTKRVPLTASEIRANEAQTNPRKRIKRKRRFVFKEEPSRLRTAERMESQGQWGELHGTDKKGVLGGAIVSDIPFFDRAESVVADYMHQLLLGVVKYFLSKMLFERGPWYIGDKIKEIDNFIKQIKVPDFVKRLPRGLEKFKMWKASEFRNFLLYYSLPIFKEFLPEEYFKHWLYLVVSSYTLLKDSISETDLELCDILLKLFVRDVGRLYGPKCYTFNVHNLIHLCLLVKRAGPLWATSAFPFEDFNGFIRALVHGTKHLGRELTNNINISLSVTILGNIVNGMKAHHVPTDSPELKNPCSCVIFDQRELDFLSENNFDTTSSKFFLVAKVTNSMYSSIIYDLNKTRCNSAVQFEEQITKQRKYGEIVSFVQSDQGSVHCLIKTFRIMHINLFCDANTMLVVRNLVPVESSEIYSVVPFKSVITKVLKIGTYLGLRPNSVEVNL